MHDGQIHDINLDELMEKIRTEVSRRKAGASTASGGLPDVSLVDRPLYNSSAGKWLQVENALSMAEQVSHVGTRLPGMHTFQGWKRKIALFVGNMYLRISQVITRDQRAFNGSILAALRSLQETTKQIESAVAKNFEYLTHVDNLGHALNELESSQSKTEKDIHELRTLVNSFESNSNRQLSDFSSRLSDIDDNTSKFQSEIENLNLELKKSLQKIDYLKTSLLLQDRRLTLLIEEARRRLPEPFSKEQLQSFVGNADDLYDPLYLQFEDQFRGTRDEIKERQQIYLPFIHEVKAGTKERPVLDLGCGRGEWLELLKEEGLLARGVDINSAMIEKCEDFGLEVYRDDMLEYLKKLPDGSVGAVTAFHTLEHLSSRDLILLFDEIVRVLKPNGLALFETPNPQNILVGACNFYIDPSHKNPLHPASLKFLAEARGLCRINVLARNPYGHGFQFPLLDKNECNFCDTINQTIARLNEFLFCGQDFSLVGYKA